jgi:hypothetical protein
VPTGGLWHVTTADRSGEPGGAQMLVQCTAGRLAANQRVVHLARAVAKVVRGGDRIFGLHKGPLQLTRARTDTGLELLVDGLNLRHLRTSEASHWLLLATFFARSLNSRSHL